MARQVVAGTDGQAAMVQRLVNWFRSGRFQYSTAAQPESPQGTPAVVTFLTRTKVGNCQTFTDAFAMMAQSLGIPVRVAVGFTSGARKPSGLTTVTGADAHTWPQVFVGPKPRWESVEPTPASSATAIGPAGVIGVGPVSTRTSPMLPTAETNANESGDSNKPHDGACIDVSNVNGAKRLVGESTGHGHDPRCVRALDHLGLRRARGPLSSAWLRRPAGRGSGVASSRFAAVLEAWRESDRSLAKVGLGCPLGPDASRPRPPTSRSDRRIGLHRERTPLEADRLGLEQLVSDVESLALLEREVRYGGRWSETRRRLRRGPPLDGSGVAALPPPRPNGPGPDPDP